MDIICELNKLSEKKVHWRKTTRESLDIDYGILLPSQTASLLFNSLENDIVYDSAEDSMIQIFGKWQKIPRQQSAFGDDGTKYKFSGKTVLAKKWDPILLAVRNLILNITGHHFNFVLINRYSNGSDYIGEHRDNEPDLDPNAPIASLSLGQARDFVLKHRDARVKGASRRNIPTVKVLLQSGSLLMMNPPTNTIWYHSLPPRKCAKKSESILLSDVSKTNKKCSVVFYIRYTFV